jgi:hypothetical protein
MPVASPVTIHNEQVKLFAASLERVGTSAVTVGVFAPIAAAFFKIEGFNRDPLPIIVGVVSWLLLAAILYIESQRKLRNLAQ